MASNWNRNRRPAWVIRQDNEDARREAARQERKFSGGAASVIANRIENSPEFLQAMANIEQAMVEIYTNLPTDEAESVARMRELGGRTAIRQGLCKKFAGENWILAEQQVIAKNIEFRVANAAR